MTTLEEEEDRPGICSRCHRAGLFARDVDGYLVFRHRDTGQVHKVRARPERLLDLEENNLRSLGI